MKKIILISVITLLGFFAKAQNVAPGTMLSGINIFTGATINTGNGQIINNASLVVENGIILEIGTDNFALKYPNAKIISVSGKQIFPGIISPNNNLGLLEMSANRQMDDTDEIGEFNPNVRSLVAYNTDSEIIPTVRANGVLISQAIPDGGVLTGRSSIFNLDGWNWEDAVLKADDGYWISWPNKFSVTYENGVRLNKKNEKYDSNIADLNALFNQTKVFNNESLNLKMAALSNLFTIDTRLYIQVNGNKETLDAINFCINQKIKYPVIVGEVNSEIIIGLLKSNNIPVLIPGTQRLPNLNDADVWEAYKMPAKLVNAGLLVGMFYNASHWRTRNLPFVAGNTVAFGLSKTDALKLITINNAKILGIDKWVGSLEKGKHATFIICNGDVLDMRTAKVEKAYIKGAEVNLENKHSRLSNKYNTKYGIK